MQMKGGEMLSAGFMVTKVIQKCKAKYGKAHTHDKWRCHCCSCSAISHRRETHLDVVNSEITQCHSFTRVIYTTSTTVKLRISQLPQPNAMTFPQLMRKQTINLHCFRDRKSLHLMSRTDQEGLGWNIRLLCFWNRRGCSCSIFRGCMSDVLRVQ